MTQDHAAAGLDPAVLAALQRGELDDPNAVLGPHVLGDDRVVVRAFHPDAVAVDCLPHRGTAQAMTNLGSGLFAVLLAGVRGKPHYRLRFCFADGNRWELEDPYRFASGIRDSDLTLFAEGRHRRLWELLGARVCRREGVLGTQFAVWAPNARAVRLVGQFCAWDGRLLPMRRSGKSGVFELFVPGVSHGDVYKYEILTPERVVRLKTDPFAMSLEEPPNCASRIVESRFEWRDHAWLRRRRNGDLRREPLAIYEVHLGSWDRDEDGGFLQWRELAPRIVAHAKRYGFTHLELLPVAEHAYYPSWGYQVTGYWAPTSRHGDADGLRWFVDHCHRNGIGVLVDWVPAHFPKDDFALRRFDGRALYEVADPLMAEHPDWGTLIFDFARPQVRNFLVANALYWIEEFHFDGLRVDAVSSMLYLDYGRKAGQWRPNAHGRRENLGAIAFLRELNAALGEQAPGVITIAEEATAWPGVTAPTRDGGLGFTFKWNMGWMNDTLRYFALDPIYRRDHQDWVTFAMHYEASERFINPLSHDEVVHLKRSLLEKMPGDQWQKYANLRLLLAYQFLRPGKKLLFMGAELAAPNEWNHDAALPWALTREPARIEFDRFLVALGALYHAHPCLWRSDPDRAGFAWIDASDYQKSILSWVRRDGDAHLAIVMNLTPVPRAAYRIGVPAKGSYRVAFSTDAREFGGSIHPPGDKVATEDEEFWGWKRSVVIDLPPLALLVLAPSKVSEVQEPPAGSIP